MSIWKLLNENTNVKQNWKLSYRKTFMIDWLSKNDYMGQDTPNIIVYGELRPADDTGRVIRYRYWDVIGFMVEHGAELDISVDYGYGVEKALSIAADSGYFGMVRYLVKHGTDIHTLYKKSLINAANKGYFNIVKYLIEHGADLHADDDYALFGASVLGNLEMVKYLVEHGAKFKEG